MSATGRVLPRAVHPRDTRYALGVVLAMLGGACLSLSGILVRSMQVADGWQIMFYRSVSFFATVLVFILVRYRGRILSPFRAVGRGGLVVALCMGLGSACYLFSILLTTVANAVFIISAAPFFTALLAWAVLGERVRGSTWASMSAALAGVGLMFADGITGGGLLGDVVALGVVLSFAVMLVVLRRANTVDMVPATGLGGIVAALIGAAMAPSLALPVHDLALCLTMGVVQLGGGFILITVGARYVPAAEVALLTLTETILAPLWVWIGVNETPSALSLAGGGIVLAAVAAQAIAGARRAHATS